MLGELLYEGKGVRRSAVQARRMWKKAAEAGDVLAMIAWRRLHGLWQGAGAALRYYRQAQTAARPTPDIAYMPQVRLRMAQYETQYLSRPRRWPRWPRQSRGSKFGWARETPPRSSGCRRRKTQSAGCWATKSGKHSFFTFALRNCHTEPVR